MSGLQSGDPSAWTALFQLFGSRIWRLVSRLLNHREADVADVVQEIFLAAARSARSFDPSRGSLWAWLTGIAHHQLARHWRQAERVELLRQRMQAGEWTQLWQQGLPDPTDVAEHQDQQDVVRAVLMQLSSHHANILIAKYMDGLSIAEICEIWGGSEQAARSRLARARQGFREIWERQLAADEAGADVTPQAE